MKPKLTWIEVLFLVLAVIGLAATWYYNALFYLEVDDTSIGNFIALTKTTLPAKSINADISVVAITFLIWMVYEARRLQMKHWWLFIPLTFLVALAFSFPLFLFFRERKIRGNAHLSKQT
ncbi:DUF2834 domain-containing protein [Flavobacteriaceae bacterium TP-CH-4]|uniref:DUF2834 domain-containing protein n=1 Tax=Pelagihabitans pacificus TaxID=2696054 RepID=A0A967AX63_9FLAO|nr:DUF2834 domain-containing protein [Pelagihabitans pacificus]NHF60793.1 DUF2834 domain-containing protein [Pelagihabitans pacificus]